MRGNEQTSLGRFFDRHLLLLRAFAVVALAWGVGYLTWRIGWSSEGADPLLFAMLLVTEVYGLWALGTLAWFSWSRPPAVRPPTTLGRSVDVYVCTYDEPREVVAATLAGCRALTYPHTTYLLDDGRRPEMRELAELAGARYLTRPDNSHAKAGNINAALPRTDGELVLMLDADHVPMPDALDATVGYFDDERMALVQTPHDFFNHDSVQHYVVGRHEQSLFYRVVCPGKDRHGAAYWCGSAALMRREALLAIGGVATETIAEDFHTTIRLQRHGWRSRYHDEVLVQGLAPHDLDGYLLQRDRWARGKPRRLHPAGVPPPRPRAAPAAAPLLLRQPRRLPGAADAPAPAAHARGGALDRRAAVEDRRRRPGGALAAGGGAQPDGGLGPGARLHEDRRDGPLRAADDGDLHAGAALRRLAGQDRIQGDAQAGRRTAAGSRRCASCTW